MKHLFDFHIKGVIPPIIIGTLHNPLNTAFSFIVNSIIYFVIGAIIGWIVEKIRNKTNLKTRAK